MIFTPHCSVTRSATKRPNKAGNLSDLPVHTLGCIRACEIALSPVYLGDYRESTKPIRWIFTTPLPRFANRIRYRFGDALAPRTTLLPRTRSRAQTRQNQAGT